MLTMSVHLMHAPTHVVKLPLMGSTSAVNSNFDFSCSSSVNMLSNLNHPFILARSRTLTLGFCLTAIIIAGYGRLLVNCQELFWQVMHDHNLKLRLNVLNK